MNKNLKIMLAIGILFLAIAMFSPAYATDISTCANITSPGHYTLINDLSGNQSGESYCINIRSNDVILDCGNHRLVGNWSLASIDQFETSGIYSADGLNNVTVKNCYITNYSTAIYTTAGISNLTIFNDTSYHNYARNAYITASNNTIINNSRFVNITNTSTDNVYIKYAKAGSRIINSNISDIPGTQKGIYLYYCNDVSVENNVFYRDGNAIVMYSNLRDNITNNSFYNLNYKAIYYMYGNTAIIANNTIIDDGTHDEYGISAAWTHNILIESNYIYFMRYEGITIQYGSHNLICSS